MKFMIGKECSLAHLLLKRLCWLLSLFVPFSSINAKDDYRSIYDFKLPVVEVHTDDGIEPSCDFVSAPAGEAGESITNNEYVSGVMRLLLQKDTIFEGGMRIKLRGNTSAYYPVKPYKIKLDEKENLLKLMGQEGSNHKEWLLIAANYKTVVGLELSRLMQMEWSPRCCFANLVINGEYRGFYLLIESVTKDKKRCNISDGGFIIENDAYWWNEDLYFETGWVKYTFKYPNSGKINGVYLDSITSFMKNVEYRIQTKCQSVSDVLDLNCFSKWEVIKDMLGSTDALGSNIFLYKDTFEVGRPTSDKVKIGPLWDFDGAFQSGTWSSIHSKEKYAYCFGRTQKCLNNIEPFVREYKNNYQLCREVVAGMVSHLTDSLSSLQDDLDGSAYLSKQKNGKLYAGVFKEQMNISDAWFSRRVIWMDSAVATMQAEYREPDYECGCSNSLNINDAFDLLWDHDNEVVVLGLEEEDLSDFVLSIFDLKGMHVIVHQRLDQRNEFHLNPGEYHVVLENSKGVMIKRKLLVR